MIILSDEKKYHLCANIDMDLAREFHIEVVNQHGQSYGSTGNCIKEAIKEWVDKSKKERMEKQKSIKE